MGCIGRIVYLTKEVVDAVKGDLGLDDRRDVRESHPQLVSQHVENCRDGSVQRPMFGVNTAYRSWQRRPWQQSTLPS